MRRCAPSAARLRPLCAAARAARLQSTGEESECTGSPHADNMLRTCLSFAPPFRSAHLICTATLPTSLPLQLTLLSNAALADPQEGGKWPTHLVQVAVKRWTWGRGGALGADLSACGWLAHAVAPTQPPCSVRLWRSSGRRNRRSAAELVRWADRKAAAVPRVLHCCDRSCASLVFCAHLFGAPASAQSFVLRLLPCPHARLPMPSVPSLPPLPASLKLLNAYGLPFARSGSNAE